MLVRELDQALATGRGGSNKTPADGVPAHIAATVRSRLAPILPDEGDPNTRRDNQALADAAIALARHRIANGDDPATAARFAVDDLTGLQAVRDDFALLPDPADEGDDAEFDEDDDIEPGDDGEVKFPPDKVARLAELAGNLTLDKSPDRPTGALGRASAGAADQNVAALDEAKAAASEAEKEFSKLMLSLIPVLGTVIDGKDAFKAFQEAERLEADGKLDEALEKRGEGSLAAFGAIPLIGAIAKAPKVAAKFKRLFDKLSPGRRAAQGARAIVDKAGFDPAIKNWTRLKSAEPKSLNDDFVKRHKKINPDSAPHRPYDENFPTVRGRYRPGQPPLVRVYAKERNRVRGWLMTRTDYEEALRRNDPAGFLQDKFALPERPKFVSDFVHKQPVDMKVGIVSKHPTWGKGGGRQFELGKRADEDWFSKSRNIPGGRR